MSLLKPGEDGKRVVGPEANRELHPATHILSALTTYCVVRIVLVREGHNTGRVTAAPRPNGFRDQALQAKLCSPVGTR